MHSKKNKIIYFYFQNDLSDVSARKKLRQNLKCKTFDWYIKNVYPELFVPGDAVASGELRNLANGDNNMCLDSPARKADYHKPIKPFPCHNQGKYCLNFFCLIYIIAKIVCLLFSFQITQGEIR